MNKFPNKDVENKIKEVEEFAKKNDLHYLYIYSSDEDIDGDVIYSNNESYLDTAAYKIQEYIWYDSDEFVIYIDGQRFCSKNA